MYNICAFITVRCFTLVRNRSQMILQNYRKTFYSTQFPMDNVRNLKKDVILYSYENKLFKILPLLGALQCGAWIYFGISMYRSLTRASQSSTISDEDLVTKSAVWKTMDYRKRRFRLVSACFCVGFGVLVAVFSLVLPTRMVREVKLCKGGNIAHFLTYNIFGRPLQLKTPIRNINCINLRKDTRTYIAIKIKPKWFYYLIESKGNFYEPRLFDYTVGTKPIKAY